MSTSKNITHFAISLSSIVARIGVVKFVSSIAMRLSTVLFGSDSSGLSLNDSGVSSAVAARSFQFTARGVA